MTHNELTAPSSTNFLLGGGEMGALMRSHDWSQTSLGSPEQWSQSLKTTVRIVLTSRQPMFVWWGDELLNLYNDAYAEFLHTKHPAALGQPALEVWSEIREQIEPRIESVIHKNEGTFDEALFFIMERKGYREETYVTFSYSPIPDDADGIGGLLCACTDDTQRIVGERQLALLQELAAKTADARTFDEACTLSAACLETNPYDLPFALIYLVDADHHQATLAGTSGIQPGHPLVPETVTLEQDSIWRLGEVLRSQQPVLAPLSTETDLPTGAWQQAPHQAVAVQIAPSGQAGKSGILVVGLNPFRLFDDNYQGFLNLVSGQIAASIANAQAYEEERKRAEALAEIDRAKTVFFSNISHEFRTPLTLMLSPLEELSSSLDERLQPDEREQLQLVQRNGLRLQKLVNTLLDFSRIEAGRVQATYEPTDLSAFTAELASVFRSTIERAEMRLVVECPPLPEEVYVDREMWEKIVLNLLSNAFKFTFAGEISVSLQWQGDCIELTVRDTGIGIPADELPHLFERFHRVKGAQGRSFEGSGIGLSLVQELVKLHQGAIAVTSVEGSGTCFTISIPTGKAHLPQDRIGAPRILASTALDTNAYLKEALRWLPGESRRADGWMSERANNSPSTLPSIQSSTPSPKILLADDNADMRDYVRRLLSQQYEVEVASDGLAALAAVDRQIPDLILTDVMMPNLDGFGLLQAIRSNPEAREIPVILLSARAGEEARVEGLAAGADDYLIKPFSARELLARVKSTLNLARIRKQAEIAIREREERLKLAVEAGRMIAWEWNPSTEVIGSTNLSEICGIDTIDSFQQGFTFIHPDDQIQHQTSVENAIATGSHYQSEFRFIRPDNGAIVWMEERGRPVLNDDGSLQKLIGVTIDITERKRAEAQLRESEKFLQAIIETAPNLLYIFDLNERRNVYVSPQIFSILGIAPAEVQAFDSQLLVELFHPDDLEQIEQHHDRIRAAQEDDIFTIEYRMRHASGRWLWLSSRDKIFVRDEQGNPTQILGSAVDITDRKQAEEDLRRSEAAFRTISNAAPALVWVCSSEGQNIYFNDRWYEFTGQTEADAAGLGWANTMHPDDAAQILPYWHRCQQTGEPYEGEVRYRRHDGEYRWHAFRALPRRNPDGEIEAWYGLSVDISDRKNSEQERERFLALGSDFQVITGINGYFHWVSPSFERLLGWTQVEMTSRPWTEFVHPDDINPSVSETDSLFSGNETFAFENRYCHKDGSYRWLLWNAQPYPDKGVIYGAAVDITERKQAELALRESEAISRTRAEELETLMEVVPVGIWLAHDPDCHHVTVNRAAYKLMRAEPGDPTTATPADNIYPFKFKTQHNGQDISAEELSLQKAGQTGQEVVQEAELVFEDGVVHYIYGRAVPLRNEAGDVRGVIGAYVDISDRKQIEAEREQLLQQEQAAREEAQRANRIKDEFLAVLSHELRSPLNPILGWSRLLLNGKLDESKTKHALATIERNAKLQSELIEDLLDVSRILRGKLSLNVTPVNLASIIRAAIDTVRLAAEAKSIAIETRLDPEIGQVSGDSTRLQQVVWNLLSNAVKFTPGGGQVTVQLEQVNNHAQITVHDTGKGISPDFLPYVFDYFRQADSATTRQFGGLGLGLAIVRYLVELHGGTVSVASPGEGQGATFIVRVPLMSTPSKENQDDRSPQDPLDLSGIKILIVDDEPDTRDLVAFVLEQQGAQVITATSAHEALLILPQAKPDVLLSDIGMPEMDGYMLIQQVRMLAPDQGGQIPAIALTAYAGDTNQQQVLAAGFQKHISKPIEPEELVQAIVHLIRST